MAKRSIVGVLPKLTIAGAARWARVMDRAFASARRGEPEKQERKRKPRARRRYPVGGSGT